MKLVSILNEKFEDYKIDLIFDCYKWDPQFLDSNTISKHVLVLTKEEDTLIKKLTEKLDKETIACENYLNNNLNLIKELNIDKKLNHELKAMNNYNLKKHIRLMRYDFHPIEDNKWAISEVNSDVPGGFAEASLLPKLAKNVIGENNYDFYDFSEKLIESIKNLVEKNATIALVHCTCFSDDRQVMQFLGDELSKLEYKVIYCAADHIRFISNKAFSILDGNEGEIDFIFRFTPIEWLKDIKPNNWKGYFNTETSSCNHPIALFAQTKRFPLIWDLLEDRGLSLNTWRELLPETRKVNLKKFSDTFIYKPANGRVGEKITIKEACIDNEYNDIMKEVRKKPKEFLMQKKFSSVPIISDEGVEFHLCLGSYTINGRHAGYYARVSNLPRIDSNALDIAVFVEGE